jgi:hypothetical protein
MKIVCVNCAASSSTPEIGGSGPIWKDGTFRYIPIWDDTWHAKAKTYRQLGLAGLVPDSEMKAHNDPDFVGLTYGDYPDFKRKHALRSTERGDILLFLASLVHRDTGRRRFYFIGWFRVAAALNDVEARKDKRCRANAHVVRDDLEDSDFTIFVGDIGGLFPRAVPIAKSLAVQTLLPKGKPWVLRDKRTGRIYTENERVNHLTRFPRAVIEQRCISLLASTIRKTCGTDILASGA